MKKIFAKLRALIIGTATSVSVIGCGSETEGKITNDLNDIIINKNLGNIIMTNNMPTKEELLIAIKDTNANATELTLEDFEFKKGFKRRIKKSIIVGKGKYKGEVSLEYSNVVFDMNKFLNHIMLLYFQKNYSEGNKIISANVNNPQINLNFKEIVSNVGITKVILSETLMNSEMADFKNATSVSQQNLSQTVSKTVTNTVSVSNRTDFGLKTKLKGKIPGILDTE